MAQKTGVYGRLMIKVLWARDAHSILNLYDVVLVLNLDAVTVKES